MINYQQSTHNNDEKNYSLLNLVLSDNWVSYALSDHLGRNYQFRSTDRKDNTPENIISDMSSRYPGLKIRVALLDNYQTLIPEALHKSEDEVDYLMHSCPLEGEVMSGSDTIYSQGLKNIYRIETDQYLGWDNMESIRFHHYLSPLLTFLPKRGQHAFLVWLHDRLVVLTCSQESIQYCNSLPCDSVESALYYILLAYKMSGFDRRETPLTMIGRFRKDSDLYKAFYKYFQNIELPAVPNVEREVAHQFFDMYLQSKYI
ncbi:MAG: DUF3822 family protein [Saprospiraceae bacterium]|nr:DUF3822 family protein [Saprospiraceae bacterium]